MGVAALFAVSPLLQTLMLQVTPKIVTMLGRSMAALTFHVLSCASPLLLAVASGAVVASAGFFLYQATVKMRDFPIYTVLLETVKPEHRGKFFHLLSIKPLTFGASAMVGGYLIDAYGYRVAMATTGISLAV